jgi:hypothetical protein
VQVRDAFETGIQALTTKGDAMNTTIPRHAWTDICSATRMTNAEADNMATALGGRAKRLHLETYIVTNDRERYLRLIER